MEKILRPEAPPASPDLTATDGCTVEVTRSNSEMSTITAENSKYTFHRLNANDDPAWTNEKHNLYLNHLEASFVDQLHRSMGFRSLCSEQRSWDSNTSCKLSAKTRNTPKQLTVIQDGCCQKTNSTASDFGDILNSPLTHHFTFGDKNCRTADLQEYSTLPCGGMLLRGKKNTPHRLTRSCKQIYESNCFHEDPNDILTGYPAEVSDQNFVDKELLKSSNSMVKRLKTAVADASTQDQTVPSGKFETSSSR